MQRLYKVFYDANIMVDVIPSNRDIKDYKIVIVPQMIITDDILIEKFKEFTVNGGRLIMTYRTAVKDRNNNLIFGEMVPVRLNAFTGISVEETESIQDYNAFSLIGAGVCAGTSGYGGVFRDMLTVLDAEVLYQYGDQFYKSYAAITRKKQEKGTVYYIGCTPDDKTLANIINLVINESGIEKIESPDGVEIVKRGNEKQQIKMVINHNSYQTEVGTVMLAPFECKIIQEV